MIQTGQQCCIWEWSACLRHPTLHSLHHLGFHLHSWRIVLRQVHSIPAWVPTPSLIFLSQALSPMPLELNQAARRADPEVCVSRSEVSVCNPKDCSPLGFSVHGILQARVLEGVAFVFSRSSSWPRDGTQGPALQMNSLQSEPPGKSRRASILGQDLQLMRVGVPASILQSKSSEAQCIELAKRFILTLL